MANDDLLLILIFFIKCHIFSPLHGISITLIHHVFTRHVKSGNKRSSFIKSELYIQNDVPCIMAESETKALL
jgi:hypothetical protein